MDGVAQSPGLQEVQLKVDAPREGPGGATADPPGAAGTNFVGQPHLDHVTGFAAFDQAQSAVGDQTAHGTTGGIGGEASTAGEPGHGAAEPGPEGAATSQASFQQAESQSDPGQAIRKKEKGESRQPQLALKTSYQIGSILQEIFLSCDSSQAL